MPSVASHDLFSVTYEAQRSLASRFYAGEALRSDLIDGFGVSYVVAPAGAPIVLEGSTLLHQEASLRLYEIPGERMKPYPGIEHLAGVPAPNGFRAWESHSMFPGWIQRFLLLDQASAAGFASRQMLAYLNDLGDREALTDGVE